MYPWQKFALAPQFSTRTALRLAQGEELTWRDVCEKINETAAFLTEQGINSESAVAFCGKNSAEILFFYLATIQLGAKILGINPAFTTEKIAELCRRYNIRYCYRNEAIRVTNSLSAVDFPADFRRPATMTLTSGSTGLPKAVVHNLHAHLENAKGVCRLMQFDATQSWLLSLPLYHVSGQGIVWRWLIAGGELHLPQSDFYASLTQATHVSLVPTQLQRLLRYLSGNKSAECRLRHILLGGSHIPPQLVQQIEKYGITAYIGYGMTEMASTVCAKAYTKIDANAEMNVDIDTYGVGKPLPGRDCQIVDEEIQLRGAGLAMGYWQQGKLISLTNQNGWFQTKDRGEWRNGELVVLGRLDNMFISGGENIQPEDIERLIFQSGLVKQAFILPVADTEFGQRPVAVIEFNEQFSPSAVKNLTEFLQRHLERFKLPISYHPFPNELTEGAIKISRKKLIDWLNKKLGRK